MALAAASACLCANLASAQSSGPTRLPLRQAERPLTLPERALRFEGGGLYHAGRDLPPPDVDPETAALLFGLGFGLIDQVELGMQATLQFHPEADVGLPSSHDFEPNLYVRAVGRHERLEIGGAVHVFLPTSDSVLRVEPGGLLRGHFSEQFRMDVGAFFPLTFENGDIELSAVRVPLSATYNPHPQLYFAVGTNLSVPIEEPIRTFVPLLLRAGFTVARSDDGPLLDLELGVNFPAFAFPGVRDASAYDPVNVSPWEVVARVHGYWETL